MRSTSPSIPCCWPVSSCWSNEANPRRDRSALIDAAILTIGVGLLSWVFVIAPNIHLTGQTWLQTSVGVAYPLGDVFLLAGLIRLAVDAGRRTPAFWLLVSSIVCLLATDSAYNLALLKGTFNYQLVLRRGLDLLLPALGRGRAASVDALARGTGRGLADPSHPDAPRVARRRMFDLRRASGSRNPFTILTS